MRQRVNFHKSFSYNTNSNNTTTNNNKALMFGMFKPKNVGLLLVSLTLLVATRSLFDGSSNLNGYFDSDSSSLLTATSSTANSNKATRHRGRRSTHSSSTSHQDGSLSRTERLQLQASKPGQNPGFSLFAFRNQLQDNEEEEEEADLVDQETILEEDDQDEGTMLNPESLAAQEEEKAQQAALSQEVHEDSEEQEDEASLAKEEEEDEDDFGLPPLPPPKFAYAFFLGGLPSSSATGPALGNLQSPAPPPDAHLGLLYNTLVSIRTLQLSGSRADFILLVHMASPTDELSPEHTRWFHELNVTIRYVPPSPSYVNEIGTVVLEKFRVLEFLEYDRVLFMNPDITPYCNLDYLMDMTYGHHAPLQPNVLLSMGDTPASGALFVVQPQPGAFQKLIHLLAKRKKQFKTFVPGIGYGVNMTTLKHSWRALGTGLKRRYSHWGFEGGDSDQGLLLHYCKYTHGNVSMAVGDEVEHFRKRKRIGITRNATLSLWEGKSCLNNLVLMDKDEDNDDEEEDGRAEATIGNQWYPNEGLRAKTSPLHTAPYMDFAKWQYNTVKPWHYPKAPPAVASLALVHSARKYWFHVLRQVDELLGLQLGFDKDTKVITDANDPEIQRAERLEDGPANWKVVPMRNIRDINPAWSVKVQALQQWALRIENPTLLTFAYEPPLIKESPSLERVSLSDSDRLALPSHESKKTGSAKDPTSMDALRSKCHCPVDITVDPCTTAAESLESWLGRRVKYYLSKRRPLCPNAARTKMHVVLPIHNLAKDALHDSVCSIACQDYPELSLLVYDDGSDDQAAKDALNDMFGKDVGVDFTPKGSKTDQMDYLDRIATNVTTAAFREYQEQLSSSSNSGLSQHVIRSTRHWGSAGATYWALQWAKQLADANDVVVVVDEGDKLQTHRALQKINGKYIQGGSMATYGRHTLAGKDGQSVEVDIKTNVGADELTTFTQFHSFKAHLLQHVGAGDFMNSDKAWLQTSTSRRLVFRRLLELAGVDRIGYTSEPLYMMHGVKQQGFETLDIEDIEDLDASRRLAVPVNAVLVLTRGASFLANQLIWLQDQTVTETKQLRVHLVNTDDTARDAIQAAIDAFAEHNKKNTVPFPIEISSTDFSENWRGSTKYLFVNELRRTEPLDALVLLDDGQYWPNTFIASLLEHQKPKSIVTWRGKTFSQAPRNPDTGTANFWVPDATFDDAKRKRKAAVRPTEKTIAFSNTQGALVDPNLWLLHHQILRLTSDLREYKDLDGLWISYVLDALLGWEQWLIEIPVPVLDSASWGNRVIQGSVFSLLPPEHSKALVFLGDKVKEEQRNSVSVAGTPEEEQRRRLMEDRATFVTLSSNEKKGLMFDTLQKTFHWNVFRQERMPVRQMVRPDFVFPALSSASAPRPGSSDKSPKRAFVCVTGQFDRFELENKIETIFKPLQKDGFTMDAALVLSSGAAKFTNHAKMDTEAVIPFYFKFETAVKALEVHDINVLSRNGTYPRIEDPPVNQQYLDLLYENQKWWRSMEDQIERVKNHARIFDSYRRCLQYADEAAVTAGYHNSSQYYQAFIRIRDDSGLNMPLDRMGPGKEVMKDLIPPPPNSVTVTECRSWWGMNDRMAIVAPDIAHLYFTRPWDVMSKGLFFDSNVVLNPESFLLNVFVSAKIAVLGHPDLKRVNRVVKQQNGEVVFFKKDKFMANCPEPFTYMKRTYDIYGWAL